MLGRHGSAFPWPCPGGCRATPPAVPGEGGHRGILPLTNCLGLAYEGQWGREPPHGLCRRPGAVAAAEPYLGTSKGPGAPSALTAAGCNRLPSAHFPASLQGSGSPPEATLTACAGHTDVIAVAFIGEERPGRRHARVLWPAPRHAPPFCTQGLVDTPHPTLLRPAWQVLSGGQVTCSSTCS